MAVFGLVSAVAGFVKVRYLVDKAVIDNMVFRAHYRITSAILFACCIIVSANNLIGEQSLSRLTARKKFCNFYEHDPSGIELLDLAEYAYAFLRVCSPRDAPYQRLRAPLFILICEHRWIRERMKTEKRRCYLTVGMRVRRLAWRTRVLIYQERPPARIPEHVARYLAV